MQGLEEGFCLYFHLFIFTSTAACPALWSPLPLLQYSDHPQKHTNIDLLWLSVSQKNQSLGQRKDSNEIISLYKVLNYLGVLVREIHIWWEDGKCIWRLIPYERASAKESSIDVWWDTLSLGSSNYVEKCLMLLCHVYVLYRFLRAGYMSFKHWLF